MIQRILLQVESEIAALTDAAKETAAGVTHEESRAENDKDTRAIEASYLARGQAKRVDEMREIHTRLKFLELRDYAEGDAIGLGALVGVEVDEEERSYFLVPMGGGRTISFEGSEIVLVATVTPVGRALVGKRVDDEFELKIGKRTREFLVLSVK